MGTRDPFTSLKPRRLSDGAVDQVVSLVRSGVLSPGTKLPPERDLVERLGVSRNSLREAVRILETMGILHVIPGRGTWVRDDVSKETVHPGASWLPTDARDITDLLEMRETLEVKAAALAAERGTRQDLAAIQQSLDRLREAIEMGDVDAIITADAVFHEAVADASKNQILADSLQSLSALVVETRRVVVSLPGRLRRMGPEHDAVAQAIVRHDADGAAKAMFAHVRRVAEEVEAASHRGRYLRDEENGLH
jgi:GntR family transcriptional repressor for pyruvate dehydrogenase complex